MLGSVVNGALKLSSAGKIAERELKLVPSHYSNVWIDEYVVMPNHVHAIVVLDGIHQYSPSPVNSERERLSRLPSLSTIVGGYKAAVGRCCRREGIPNFEWQTRFYDHVLGSNASIDAVRDYIRRNPESWIDDPDRPATITTE